MTDPYPPPSHQSGGDARGGVPNAPFGPSTPGDQSSPHGVFPPGHAPESPKPSPHESVQPEPGTQIPPPPQYPPTSGPHGGGPGGYGPLPHANPPPPLGGGFPTARQKSGLKAGLIAAGITGGVVLLIVLTVVIIVDLSGGPSATYDEPTSDLCRTIASDLEDMGPTGLVESDGDNPENINGGTSVSCIAQLDQSSEDGYSSYANLFATVEGHGDGAAASSSYDARIEDLLDSCDFSDIKGDWEQGTAADCPGSTGRVVVQDGNLFIELNLEQNGIIEYWKGTLSSMAEKILDDLKT